MINSSLRNIASLLILDVRNFTISVMVKQALRSTAHRERMRSSYISYIGSFVDGYPCSCYMKPSACHGQAGSIQQSTCRRASFVVVLRAAAGSSGSALVDYKS